MFKEWLVNEAAIGPQNIQYDERGNPNFRVFILNGGISVGLETLRGGHYKFAGDMHSNNTFGNSELLKGQKIFNWHSDLPEGAGYGPMFYEICMEIATNKGGCLASMTLVNRLAMVKSGHDFDPDQAKEMKGSPGGDTDNRAEGVYKKFHERNDIEKMQPNVALPPNDAEIETKPWMYKLYRKRPTVMPKLIEMNGNGQPVFVSGTSFNARPIMDMHF